MFYFRPAIVSHPQVDLQKETLINFLSLEVGSIFPQLYRAAELIKEPDGKLMLVQWKWKELSNRGQEPRQEEGIPPPSAHSRLMRSELREHPCLPVFSFRFSFFFKPAWELR